MRVIVFGGSGFLGSHIADILTKRGYEVTVFDLVVSPYLQKNQKMLTGNILNKNEVFSAVGGHDIAYNFAGIADLGESMEDPAKTLEVNILGNMHILEACRIHRVQRYVFASSLYVYSSAGSFYKTSKRACELVIENYYEAYSIPFTILRFGSLYGPRANRHNSIFQILRQAMYEKKITRFGNGEELREYIHVEDAANCSVDILSDEFKNEYVVITGHQQMRVKDLMVMVNEILGNKLVLEFLPTESDVHYQVTPYSFVPKIAKKYFRTSYLDIGQGLLHCIEEIHKERHDTEGESCLHER